MNKEIFVKFAGRNIAIKFDNFAIFRLAKEGLSERDLLAVKGAEEARYCQAWAVILGVEFDGDCRSFLNKFDGGLLAANMAVIDAMERDGIVAKDTDSKKKTAGKKTR